MPEKSILFEMFKNIYFLYVNIQGDFFLTFQIKDISRVVKKLPP